MVRELFLTSTPQLPFKRPHIPTNRDHKALNRGTLGGLGKDSTRNRLERSLPASRSVSPRASASPPRPLHSGAGCAPGPNVPLLRALWSLFVGIWGLLKGSWGAAGSWYSIEYYNTVYWHSTACDSRVWYCTVYCSMLSYRTV